MGSLGGVYCVLVILVIVQRNTQANHIDFLRRPHSRCVLLGATASFQCSVQGYVTVYWCFTKPRMAKCNLNEDFNDFNYTTNYTTTSNVTCSRLHVPARTHYNGSRFKCCFIGARRRRHCSRPASLAVSDRSEGCKMQLLPTPTLMPTPQTSTTAPNTSPLPISPVPMDLPTKQSYCYNVNSSTLIINTISPLVVGASALSACIFYHGL